MKASPWSNGKVGCQRLLSYSGWLKAPVKYSSVVYGLKVDGLYLSSSWQSQKKTKHLRF